MEQNNKQIVMNQEFKNRIQTLTNVIKQHENVILKLNTQKGYVITENTKISILFQLDMVLQTLRTIENTIALAKLNIVTRQLLTINELKIVAEQLKQANVKLDSLEDAYNYLSITVLYHGRHLIISIDIPRVSPIIYERMIIEELPILNKTVNIDHQTVLVHSNETMAVLAEFEQIAKIHIYKRNQLLNITNDLCVAPLVRGRSGKCPFKETPPTTEYKLLTYGTLVVKATLENVVMSSTCGINRKELKGNYLIIFQNCSVIIQDRLFENLELHFNHPIISPLEINQIEETSLEKYYNTSYLHEMHIENRKHLDSLKIHNFSSIGAMFALTMIIILVTIYRRRNAIATFFIRRTGRASLGDGVVNDETANPTWKQTPTAPSVYLASSAASNLPRINIPSATRPASQPAVQLSTNNAQSDIPSTRCHIPPATQLSMECAARPLYA
ncbi:uncharacterized protein LOC129779571 [Toxorhynchites rutilus septentrionalis]|uniref:uncharacterized protein LOC129779571 n=1 Tax=Toxorhynchites rutilus septentrionalis TaxID=329112 RepID=UPI002478BB6C|nr:uncharacterized protein LOC129779571 [Toxorhynchites rutilus septentrionalis]